MVGRKKMGKVLGRDHQEEKENIQRTACANACLRKSELLDTILVMFLWKLKVYILIQNLSRNTVKLFYIVYDSVTSTF